MELFRQHSSAPIAVVGLGGGGCSAVRHMARDPVPGCRYMACDSDEASLRGLPAGIRRILIDGRMDSVLGSDNLHLERATERFQSVLGQELQGTELVLMTAGTGGPGAELLPTVARAAREKGAMVIGIVTGATNFGLAKTLGVIEGLRAKADNVILIDYRRLVGQGNRGYDFTVFEEAVSCTIKAICRLLNVPGRVAVDRDKVKAILGMLGGAMPAIGVSVEGSAIPALEAAAWAISKPFAGLNLSEARGVLVHIEAGPDLTLEQASEAAAHIAGELDTGASMVFGLFPPDEKLGGTVRITLLATGIDRLLPSEWEECMHRFRTTLV